MINTKLMETDENQQPYRATRLWNEVILAFRTGMPLRRHRHRLWHYSDCFTAADCISWLNCYLKNNPNFGPQVTRQQTMQLLQKFVKCHVIESAISKSSKIDFKDNSHLYKFVQYSPLKIQKQSPLPFLLRTPLLSRDANIRHSDSMRRSRSSDFLNSVNGKLKFEHYRKTTSSKVHTKYSKHVQKDSIPECRIIERRLAVTEVENIWKTAALTRLEQLLNHAKIEELADFDKISGKILMHNSSKISKTGVVTLIDKSDDVPHWVISAMKCLANWPEAIGSGSCLPKYPGFEKDVFKVVKNYFLNPQITLIPPELTCLIEAAIYQFMGITMDKSELSTSRLTSKSKLSSFTNNTKLNDQKTSTPMDSSKVPSDQAAVISNPELNIQSLEGQLILNDSDAMWENPLDIFYETEFYSCSPVTRLVKNCNSSSGSRDSLLSFVTANSLQSGSSDSMSTLSACSRMTKLSKCPTVENYQLLEDRNDDDEEASFNMSIQSHLNGTFKCLSQENLDLSDCSARTAKCNESLKTIFSENQSSICHQRNSMNHSIHGSSSNLHKNSTNKSELIASNIYNDSSHSANNSNSVNLRDIFQSSNVMTSASSEGIKQETKISKDEPNMFLGQIISQDSEYQKRLHDLKETLQVIFLFLPTPNRRQLHFLLRMMNKILKNNKLILDTQVPTKDYLLETFLPAVMKLDSKPCLSLRYVYEVFLFTVKECDSLLKPLDVLKNEVQERVAVLQRQRIKYSLDDSASLTFCELISQQQYEEQKLSVSKQALFDLLESIIQNEKMLEKEKRKKLKQFKMNHPDIFKMRFPDPIDIENLFSKSRKPLLSRFLSLRM